MSKFTSTAVSSRVTQSLFIIVLCCPVRPSVRPFCMLRCQRNPSARALRHAVCCGGGNRTRAHPKLFREHRRGVELNNLFGCCARLLAIPLISIFAGLHHLFRLSPLPAVYPAVTYLACESQGLLRSSIFLATVPCGSPQGSNPAAPSGQHRQCPMQRRC